MKILLINWSKFCTLVILGYNWITWPNFIGEIYLATYTLERRFCRIGFLRIKRKWTKAKKGSTVKPRLSQRLWIKYLQFIATEWSLKKSSSNMNYHLVKNNSISRTFHNYCYTFAEIKNFINYFTSLTCYLLWLKTSDDEY